MRNRKSGEISYKWTKKAQYTRLVAAFLDTDAVDFGERFIPDFFLVHLRGLDAQCTQSAPTSDSNSASTNGTDGSSRVLRAIFTQFSWTKSGFSV